MRLRLVLALVTVLGALAVPAVASAQQLTIAQATSLPRVDSAGKDVQKRDQRFKPEGVSYQDCIDNQGIRFSLTITPAPEANAQLQAWAALSGADCSQQTARTGNSAVCWRITTGIPLSTNPIVTLPVRKIIGGRNNGKDATKDQEEGRDTVDVCGTIDLTTITLQFLYFRPGDQATAATKVDVPIVADTIGPVAPTGLKILPGNTRLAISFDALGEGGVVELSQIRAYCDPNPGQAVSSGCDATTSATDADGDADDAGASTCDASASVLPTSSEGGVCASSIFKPADGKKVLPDADFNAKYECGNLPVSSTGSTLIARSLGGNPLQNGKTYAVALAATDSFLNVGPLSDVVCEYPEETEDFWSDYKSGGGRAGGGFCSVDAAGSPVGSFTMIGVCIVFGASALRRLRRRNRG